MTDELFDNWSTKNSSDFRKCWNSKYKKHFDVKTCINGSPDNASIAESFRVHLSSIYNDSGNQSSKGKSDDNCDINLKNLLKQVDKMFICAVCQANYNWEQSLRKHLKFNHFMVYSRNGPPRPMTVTKKDPLANVLHRAQKRGRMRLRKRDQMPIPEEVLQAVDVHSSLDSNSDDENLLVNVVHESEVIQAVAAMT